jgi:hypothetical protein
MVKHNSKAKARKSEERLIYLRMRCCECGGWTNILGAGRTVEDLVRIGLCAKCFAKRCLGVTDGEVTSVSSELPQPSSAH